MGQIEKQIYDLTIKVLNTLGLDIVRVKLHVGSNKKLEILIEKLNYEEKLSIADCKKASQYISAVLDVEDIIYGKYFLEVSSVGIERPLVKFEDYKRFLGVTVLLKLSQAIQEQKTYRGKLISTENDNIITLGLQDRCIRIPFHLIQKACIVLTDDMFRQIIKK